MHSKVYKFFLFVIWWSIISLFFYFKVHSGLSYEELSLQFYNQIQRYSLFWWVIFVCIYGLRPLIFFPASFLTFISWVLWGPIYWTLFATIWSNLSGQVWYFISLFLRKEFFSFKWRKSEFMEVVWKTVQESPFSTILSLRLLFTPYDLVSFFAWFMKVSWKDFTLWTFLWTLPATITFVFAWSWFHNTSLVSFSEAFSHINITFLYFASGIFIMSLFISKIIKKKFKNN